MKKAIITRENSKYNKHMKWRLKILTKDNLCIGSFMYRTKREAEEQAIRFINYTLENYILEGKE